MNVINNEKITRLFAEVEIGEIFQYNYLNSGTYMKIWEVNDNNDGYVYNAVHLNSGDLSRINDSEKVMIFPKAKLVLND